MSDATTLRNRVQELREDRAWTKTELARRAEVALQTLRNMEKGLPTKRHTRVAVAKALGARYEDVFPNNSG